MSLDTHNTNKNTDADLLQKVENIYIEFYLLADSEINGFSHMDFIKRLSQYQIPFKLARELDKKYYEVNSSYWSKAFNFPKVGDEISTGDIVTAVGFLTFQVGEVESDEDLEYESDDLYDELDPYYPIDYNEFYTRISKMLE